MSDQIKQDLQRAHSGQTLFKFLKNHIPLIFHNWFLVLVPITFKYTTYLSKFKYFAQITFSTEVSDIILKYSRAYCLLSQQYIQFLACSQALKKGGISNIIPIQAFSGYNFITHTATFRHLVIHENHLAHHLRKRLTAKPYKV